MEEYKIGSKYDGFANVFLCFRTASLTHVLYDYKDDKRFVRLQN